jgi:hypothetical protein
VPDNVNTNGCVAFNFNHLLSKVHFKFTNTSKSANYKFIIRDIKVYGQYISGTYTIGAETPWAATGAVAATDAWSFGTTGTTAIAQNKDATSDNALLFIPGKQKLTISFTRELWVADETSPRSTDIITSEEPLEVDLKENGAYTISVTLDAGTAISFTLDALGGWDNKPDNITIP